MASYRIASVALLAALLAFSCGRKAPPPHSDTDSGLIERDEFSVMSYNLNRYGYHDRTGDAQAVDAKPEDERQAVIEIISEMRPDVLALQEIGGPLVFDEFRAALAEAGLTYDVHLLLQRDHSEINLAVLSRYPIITDDSRLDDVYSIGDTQLPVERGFVDVVISINAGYQFRLMVAQFKDETYNALGQTEMRRNEARLLNKHVRHALQKEPRLNLLVVGDFNDFVGAAPLRTLMGQNQEYLTDLRPSDRFGEIWTVFDAENEQYLRYDYMLASPYMRPENVEKKTRIIRHPAGKRASTHRPLFAVFKTHDISPSHLPLLPSYEDDE